jgi:soluble lytic murein transglycosylase-like protein
MNPITMMGMVVNQCILLASLYYNVDQNLIKSIIYTESKYQHKVLGSLDDVGLMQIRHTLVPHHLELLQEPCVNIFLGTKILSEIKYQCKHKLDKTFVICYNKGVTGGSRINYPLKDTYYKKVKTRYDTNTLYIYRKHRVHI